MSAMEIIDKLKCLYDGDTKNAYAALRELEALSEHENILYPYVDKFIAMLKNEKYVVAVKNFLLSKQIHTELKLICAGAVHSVVPFVVSRS